MREDRTNARHPDSRRDLSLVLLAGCGSEAAGDNAIEAHEPMILEIADPTGPGAARIQLDL